jgi:hypothetical protein
VVDEDAGFEPILQLLAWISLLFGVGWAIYYWANAARAGGGGQGSGLILMSGLDRLVQGAGFWALFLVVATISQNLRSTDRRVAGVDVQTRPESEPRVRAEAEPGAGDIHAPRYEGVDVAGVVVHAFGVSWGRTSDGQIVYLLKDSDEWLLYDPTSTNLRPPQSLK